MSPIFDGRVPARNLSVLYSCLFLAMTCACVAHSAYDGSKLPPRAKSVIRAAQQRVTSGELPSLAISIAKEGKIIYEKAYGWADSEKRVSATPHTKYAVGSIAKSITGTAVFLLVDRGKITLDAPISAYGVTVQHHPGNIITVRDLLGMTAGVPHGWFYSYGTAADEDSLLDRYAIGALPTVKYFVYSNFSYGLLGRVIEKAGQKPYPQFVRQELLDPLGMNSSGFDTLDSSLSIGYDAGKPVLPHMFYPQAGGGFYSSAHDLALFGQFHLDDFQRVISPSRMKEMHTVAPGHELDRRYASGWGVLRFDDGGSVLISDGRVLGGSGTLLLLPREKVVISCVTNMESDAPDELAFQLADAFSASFSSNFETLRKRSEVYEASRPFRAADHMRGIWAGMIETPQGEVPIRLEIDKQDRMELQVAQQTTVQVERLHCERDILMGDAKTSISLPETAGHDAILRLQLVWLDETHLTGAISSWSKGSPPRFSLPMLISLRKHR